MDRLAGLSEEQVAWTLIALYDLVDDLEAFAKRLDLDPKEPETVALYDSVHASYVDGWTDLGYEVFMEQIESHRRYLP